MYHHFTTKLQGFKGKIMKMIYHPLKNHYVNRKRADMLRKCMFLLLEVMLKMPHVLKLMNFDSKHNL